MDIQEKWVQIKEFPNYCVSNYGRVRRISNNRILTRSPIQKGIMTVGLMFEGEIHRRSVSLLVATTFISPPKYKYDVPTPIHLDGDRSNCRVDNLRWRPRWFAIHYHKQITLDLFPRWNGLFELIDTGEIYSHPRECAKQYGLLQSDIHIALLDESRIFPYGYSFRFM